MRRTATNKHGKSALICLTLSAALVLLCSMSSPLYPINIWDDANCLLTVGRVMKEGGVLYRDIYEQKGPLLYLIHMLAAMVSDTSFFGVFLMEVFSIAAVLFFAQKTVRLWTSGSVAWSSALLFGAFMVTSRAFARGDSAEEFCLPYLMTALYMVSAHGMREKGPMPLRSMLLLGVLAGFVAMIKYTALGLFVGLCAAQGVVMLCKKDVRGVLRSAGSFLAGMALPVLPWIAYFALHGALGDAYTAYIHNNIFLYNASARTAVDLLKSVALAGRQNIGWALAAALGVLLTALQKKLSGFARTAIVLAALCTAAAVFLPGEVYPYYPLVLCVFAPFGWAAVLQKVEHMPRRGLLPLAVGLSLTIAVLLSPNAFLRGVPLSDTAQGRLAAQMEPGATLLQYSHLDDGLYLTTGALPQEKFFVLLNVDYPQMKASLDAAVREGKPDYVLMTWRELPKEFDRYMLVATDVGYDDDGRLNKAFYLYRRKAE